MSYRIPSFLVLLCVCLLCLFKNGQSTVLGIDYGSNNIKIAAVQPGRAFEIVLDEASKRAHPSLVVFDDDVRQYGTQGSSLVSRRPTKSFLQFTKLLGKPYNTTMIDELKKDYIFNEMTKDDKRGTLRFISPYYNPDKESSIDDVITAQSYSVEEITSMKFKHIKKIAESFTDGDVTDCVITVPHFWSMKERIALRDAAQLAGLNVYGLINENTAAAVQYGLKRDFSSNKTEYYIFYNMGSSSTQVSIVKYWAYDVKERSKTRTVGCVDVMSQSWDETLGGNSFDRIVSNIIIERAKELLRKQTNPKIDDSIIDNLENNARFTARIRTAANKAKKILSANIEASVNIEGVYDDIDLRTLVTREELYSEAESQSLFERTITPLNDAIENVNGKVDQSDIQGIVLVGGSTRIPRIKQLLTEYLDKELRQDLNADEAPAFGAAFRAANLSSTFRVLGVNLEDISPFPVGVRLGNLADKGKEIDKESDETIFAKRGSLFSKNNNVYKRRAVTLKHSEDLYVNLFYEKYANLPTDTSTDLGSYEITGINDAVAKYSKPDYNISTEDGEDMPKISLSFLLDADSIVDLVQATATFTEYITEEKKISKKSSTATDTDDSKDSDNTSNTNDTEGKGDETSDGASDETSKESESSETTQEGDSDAGGEEGSETELITRKKTHRVELKVTKFMPNDVKSYDETDFEQSTKVLMELDERDHRVLATASARNELESYIFESRSKLYEDSNVEKVSTAEERDDLVALLTEAEDWIWEVEEETESIFTSKTRELRKIGDKIFNRASELEYRPKAIDAAGKAIGQLYEYIETLKTNYSWVNITDTNRLEEMTKNMETWLNDKIEEQSKLSLTEDPAFQSTQVQRKLVPILEYAQKLLSKPKPYDYYKKKKDKKAKNGTKSGNETDETETEVEQDSETSGDAGSEGTDDSGTSEAEEEEDPYSIPINVDEDEEEGGDDVGGEKKGEL